MWFKLCDKMPFYIEWHFCIKEVKLFTPDLYTDIVWVERISYKLENFKKVSGGQNVYNCRCPVCGDSKKRQNISRFYVYTSKSNCLNVDCKNCGYGKTFYNFMKDVFPDDFIDYKKEQISSIFGRREYKKPKKDDKSIPTHEHVEVNEPKPQEYVKYLTAIDSLDDSHEAKKYLKKRSLPDAAMSKLFYCDRFKELCETISYKPLAKNFPDEPRIIIPFYSVDGDLEMIQGRCLSSNGFRYITIKCSPDVDKVFGKNHIDVDKTTYVCEGPFDSLFVDNCVATCDSSLTRVNVDTYIWDNEPRNPDIHRIMLSAIKNGKNIVIWPFSPERKIDINDMINSGITQPELMSIIKDNTYSGPKALIEFYKWKKI